MALLVIGVISGAPGTTRAAPCAGSSWQSVAPLAEARSEVTAAVYGGRVYVIGGFDQTGSSNAVEAFDPARGSWETVDPLPLWINHAMAASHNEGLFVFGGHLGVPIDGALRPSALPSDRVFRLSGSAWTQVASMPEARAAGAAVTVGDKIYVVGGTGPTGALAEDTLVYDVATDTWSLAPGLSQPRKHLGVAALRGRVYAIGGRTGAISTNLATVEVFDPAARRWSDGPSLPRARGGLAATAIGDGIVAIGGDTPERAFGDADMLGLGKRRWVALPSLLAPRHGLGVVALDGAVYAVAGGARPSASATAIAERLPVDTCPHPDRRGPARQ